VDALQHAVIREALVNAEAGITIFTDDRQFVAVNDQYLVLSGYSRDDLATHRVGANLPLKPLEEDEFIAMITSALSAGETDIVRKDGRRLAVEYIVIPTSIDGRRHFIGMMWPLIRPGAPGAIDG